MRSSAAFTESQESAEIVTWIFTGITCRMKYRWILRSGVVVLEMLRVETW